MNIGPLELSILVVWCGVPLAIVAGIIYLVRRGRKSQDE